MPTGPQQGVLQPQVRPERRHRHRDRTGDEKENAQVKRSLVKEFKQYPQLFSLFIDLLVMFILSLGAAVDLKGK